MTEAHAAPELLSERLRLRAWRAADFEDFAAQYADEDAARFIGGPLDRALAWRKFASVIGHWALRGFGLYALETREDARFVGACGLWMPESWPQLEIGYWLRPAQQGQGYASEAVRRVREHAIGARGERELVSYIVDANTPSRAVAERVGCRRDGELTLMGQRAGIYRHPVDPA